MEPLDKPISLNYKNGKVFPTNAVFMGYVFLIVSIPAGLFGIIYIGIGLFIISIFMIFTTYGTQIHPDQKKIEEYTKYFGFIQISKTYSYENHKYICSIPVKLTTQVYGRSSNSTTISNYYHSISILNQNFKNRKDITKFEQKSVATDTAKNLAHRLGLEYFEYDPKVIREKMLRNL